MTSAFKDQFQGGSRFKTKARIAFWTWFVKGFRQEHPEVLPSQATFLINMPLGRPSQSVFRRSKADAVDACAVASCGVRSGGRGGTLGP